LALGIARRIAPDLTLSTLNGLTQHGRFAPFSSEVALSLQRGLEQLLDAPDDDLASGQAGSALAGMAAASRLSDPDRVAEVRGLLKTVLATWIAALDEGGLVSELRLAALVGENRDPAVSPADLAILPDIMGRAVPIGETHFVFGQGEPDEGLRFKLIREREAMARWQQPTHAELFINDLSRKVYVKGNEVDIPGGGVQYDILVALVCAKTPTVPLGRFCTDVTSVRSGPSDPMFSEKVERLNKQLNTQLGRLRARLEPTVSIRVKARRLEWMVDGEVSIIMSRDSEYGQLLGLS